MKKLPRAAFSLIEVVVALGLFSFCIIGIMGLLAVAMGSTRSVADESNAADIASSVAGLWEVAPTNNTPVELSDSATNAPMGQFTIGAATSTFYYDADGRNLPNATGATLRMDYKAEQVAGQPGSYAVSMTFLWPASGPTNAPTVNRRYYRGIFVK